MLGSAVDESFVSRDGSVWDADASRGWGGVRGWGGEGLAGCSDAYGSELGVIVPRRGTLVPKKRTLRPSGNSTWEGGCQITKEQPLRPLFGLEGVRA